MQLLQSILRIRGANTGIPVFAQMLAIFAKTKLAERPASGRVL